MGINTPSHSSNGNIGVGAPNSGSTTSLQTVRCYNCGWSNEISSSRCAKCGATISSSDEQEDSRTIERILQKNEYSNETIRNNTYPQRDRHVLSPYPHSIHVLTLTNDERLIINSNECRYSDIDKRTYLSAASANLIREHIESSRSKRKYPESYYLCPICGTVLKEDASPMTFGDDYICTCPHCNNEFQFGGTYPRGYNYSYIDVLSPNHNTIASSTLIKKAKRIALFRRGTTLYSDNLLSIAKPDGDNYIVTDIIWL